MVAATEAPLETQVAEIGKEEDRVPVSIGPQFLNSSASTCIPRRTRPSRSSSGFLAAGALTVYVGVPQDLSDPLAAVWVLDDGDSMDLAGLHALWAIAKSNKRLAPPSSGRPQIGKFGIGKLATYILANQLTYVCKATDGAIRAVTMDYRDVHEQAVSADELHNPVPVTLPVRRLDDSELDELLRSFAGGDRIRELIHSGVPRPAFDDETENEFNGEAIPVPPKSETWTLALLTALKPIGQRMQAGWIRRLLRTALPLGDGLVIVFNDEPLPPSKIEIGVAKDWVIGTASGFRTSGWTTMRPSRSQSRTDTSRSTGSA